MRKHILAAGIAAVALIPSLAFAQETCEQRSANRATGTVLGAIGGALIGNALGSHGGKTGGTIIGGVAGAAVGSNLAKGPHDCVHAYGYYDSDGRWHDNHTDRAVAYGYYDRGGAWIDGPPPGVGGYAADAAYTSPPMSIDARIARIDQRIRRSRDDNSLSGREARDATRTLNDIRREVNDRGYGQLTGRDRDDVERRLDDLSAQIHMDRNGG
jgi:YMGG-like Gly-zipper